MIDDWVNKGPINLNMSSNVGDQIRSLSSKQSKWNFWNRLHQKIAFLCNSESYDWHSFFGTKFRVGQIFLLTVGSFFNEREYSEYDWLVPLVSMSLTPFTSLFAHTSQSQMSKLFRFSKSLGKSNGKKLLLIKRGKAPRRKSCLNFF